MLNSERKIDRIEDRLTGIETLLSSLTTKLGNISSPKDNASSPSLSSRIGVVRNVETTVGTTTPTIFEGETTINSQSDFARELLAQAIGKTPSIEQNAEIKTALSALKELVNQQSQIPISWSVNMSREFADDDPTQLDRPPFDVVVNAIKKASQLPMLPFAIMFPVLKWKKLREVVDDVYLNPGSCIALRRMLAYGALRKIFADLRAMPLPGHDIHNFDLYSSMCQKNLEAAINELEIFIPAGYESIMALMIGAMSLIELCKPTICWVMVTIAAGMCRDLGYHRIQAMANDDPQDPDDKIRMFWIIYMFDKKLSLRLGRASIMQDWDVSLTLIPNFEGPMYIPKGGEMLSYWIKVARVQGLTYEKLFSPAAFLQPVEERARIAKELVNTMNQAWYERPEVVVVESSAQDEGIRLVLRQMASRITSPDKTETPSKRRYLEPCNTLHRPTNHSVEKIMGLVDSWQDIVFYTDVVGHYSTCAMIQRAISTDNSTFNQECLESSRAALAAHMRASSHFNTDGNEEMWLGYLHWSVLNSPFTPFIVIFCHVIQQQHESSDLHTLFNFVASLESCRTLSEGVDKLYKMCHMFSQIARLYIQAKTQADAASRAQMASQNNTPNYYTPVDGTHPGLDTVNSFDPYLSALGLMPNWGWPIETAPSRGQAEVTSRPNVYTSTQVQAAADPQSVTPATVSLAPPGGPQNSVQDWFSGSRYLMNYMEGANDLQMVDWDL